MLPFSGSFRSPDHAPIQIRKRVAIGCNLGAVRLCLRVQDPIAWLSWRKSHCCPSSDLRYPCTTASGPRGLLEGTAWNIPLSPEVRGVTVLNGNHAYRPRPTRKKTYPDGPSKPSARGLTRCKPSFRSGPQPSQIQSLCIFQLGVETPSFPMGDAMIRALLMALALLAGLVDLTRIARRVRLLTRCSFDST